MTIETLERVETPRYRLLAKAPMDRGDGYLQLFEPGTIFESTALPGMHWQPLNAAALNVMNAWLDEETDVLDDKFRKTGEKISRRAIAGMPDSPLRLSTEFQEPVEKILSRILAVPDRKDENKLSLAQARFSTATPYSPPPPEQVPQLDLDPSSPAFLSVAEPESTKEKPIPAVRRH